MRLAIVSDIHGNLPALEAVVHDIDRRGVDAVVNLGDSLSGPLFPLETAQYLMSQNWVHLAGNHERQILSVDHSPRGASDEFAYSKLTESEFTWLRSLLPCVEYGADVLLCHGTPISDIEYFLETVEAAGFRTATQAEVDHRLGRVSAALIACGHTHLPRTMRASSGQLIVNPGSVGLQAYDDDRPYTHAVEIGSPDARYAIVERVAETWISSLIAVPYAHETMSKLAAERGRPDWAHALQFGRMP